MYEVGGMNTVLTDVAALSPDFAIAVGKVERVFEFPRINAFVWNGFTLAPTSLPIYPNDTVTIDPQHGTRTWVSWSRLNAIWAFRRDNIWYASETGAIAHMTISGRDTSVRQDIYSSIGEQIGFASMRIWAKDTSELCFGGYQGRVARYKSGVWTAIPLAIQGQLGDARDLFGIGGTNILFSIVGNLDDKSPSCPTWTSQNRTGRMVDIDWHMTWFPVATTAQGSPVQGVPSLPGGGCDVAAHAAVREAGNLRRDVVRAAENVPGEIAGADHPIDQAVPRARFPAHSPALPSVSSHCPWKDRDRAVRGTE